MSKSLGISPEIISDAFTDDGSLKRCLVRYRLGNEEWKTFWERSRNEEEDLKLERNYDNWEEDEVLKETSYYDGGVGYILRRLELMLPKPVDPNPGDDEDWKYFRGSSFNSDR